MRLLLLGLVGAAAACSGPDPVEKREAVSCSIAERSGTYLTTFETVSGDCGDIPQVLGRIDSAEALPDICAFDAADRWPDGECKLERAYSCLEEGIGPGVQSHTVAVTTQDDDAGARISGTVTMRVTNAAGAQMCVGTYTISAVRQ